MSAIYHQVEMSSFSASQGYRLARQLQEALIYRREMKRQQERVLAVMPLIEKMDKAQQEAASRLSRCESRQAQFTRQDLVAVLDEVAAASDMS